jgi:hypothetical protein
MNVRARLLILAASLVACDGSRDAAAPAAREAVEQPPPAPKPEPIVDRSLGAGFEVRKPIVDGRLTLVPIIATRAVPDVHYVTLAAGLASGQVEVTEAGPALVVDTLHVVNRSDRPLFVLQGELVIEGRQDRITAESQIVAPGATDDLKVRCVEHSRASGSDRFKPGHAIGELALRRTLAFETQPEVWGVIDAINKRLRLAPPTKTYRLAAAAQSANDARRARIVAQLARREERDRIVGYAVAVDGELLAIDRVDSPAIMKELEPMLLASYLADTDGPVKPHAPLTPDAVRTFAASRVAAQTATSYVVLRERDAAAQAATRYHYD